MNLLSQVASSMQAVLTTVCDTLARATGKVKRHSKQKRCPMGQNPRVGLAF